MRELGARRASPARVAHLAALAAAAVGVAFPPAARGEERSVLATLEEMAVDPTIEEVQAAALREAALEPSRTRSILSRLRFAGALPRIEVSVSRGFERDEDLDREFQEMDELSLATDDDLELRCTARWDLDRLVYDPEELRAARQATDDARRRRELLLAVTTLYFEQLLLRAQGRLERAAGEEAVQRAVRIAEIVALLDGLTGGIMSRGRGPR